MYWLAAGRQSYAGRSLPQNAFIDYVIPGGVYRSQRALGAVDRVNVSLHQGQIINVGDPGLCASPLLGFKSAFALSPEAAFSSARREITGLAERQLRVKQLVFQIPAGSPLRQT